MLQLSMVDTIHMVTTDHTTHMATHTGGKYDLSKEKREVRVGYSSSMGS